MPDRNVPNPADAAGAGAAALARLTEASRGPALIVVRQSDIGSVLALLTRVADERDTLRAMMRRDQ
jgi:hypothetical protein